MEENPCFKVIAQERLFIFAVVFFFLFLFFFAVVLRHFPVLGEDSDGSLQFSLLDVLEYRIQSWWSSWKINRRNPQKEDGMKDMSHKIYI